MAAWQVSSAHSHREQERIFGAMGRESKIRMIFSMLASPHVPGSDPNHIPAHKIVCENVPCCKFPFIIEHVLDYMERKQGSVLVSRSYRLPEQASDPRLNPA